MASIDADFEDQHSKGGFATLMGEGKWMDRKGEYKKAIDRFKQALALKPSDKHCFVARSRCYLKMGEFENALRDAEASLKSDKSFFEGLYLKAEALYFMGEFEFALVFYHRGHKVRPQMQGCRLGIQKAQAAIENSVGSPSNVKLEIKGDLSFLNTGGERAKPIAAIQNLTKEKKQKTEKTPKSEKTTKLLLGEFYSDKKFLEYLMKDEDFIEGTTKSGEKVKDIIESSLSSIDTCTEFWHQENPTSAQEMRQKFMQQKFTKPHHSAHPDPAQFLLKSLREIDRELMSGNAEGSLKKAEEVMNVVQRWSEKEVPNKKEVLGTLHSCIGNALVDLENMGKALEHHQKDLEMAKQCKLPGAMSRALENIGQVYVRTEEFAQAIDVWEKKLPLVCSDLEKTWLLHEVGLCYVKLDHHEEARDYGVRSVAAADGIADKKWQLHTNVLVAESELKLGNFESCVTHFERALSYATLLEDDSAMDAVEKALREAKQHLTQ